MTLVIYLMLSTFSDVCWIDACMQNVSRWAVPAKREWKQVKKKFFGRHSHLLYVRKLPTCPKKYVINPYDKDSQISNKKQKWLM